jgi:hypothetical protein
MARATSTTDTTTTDELDETSGVDAPAVETAEEKLARLRGSFVKAPAAEVEVNPADVAREQRLNRAEDAFEKFFTELDAITEYGNAEAKVKAFTSLATTKSRVLTVINGLTDEQLLTESTAF